MPYPSATLYPSGTLYPGLDGAATPALAFPLDMEFAQREGDLAFTQAERTVTFEPERTVTFDVDRTLEFDQELLNG